MSAAARRHPGPGRLCLALLLPILAGAGPLRAEEADDRFWDWFGREHEALLEPATSADRREALSYWLGRVHPGLSYELDAQGRRKTLTLSADGDFGLFATVRRLVDAAPKVKGWKFVALRQKRRDLRAEPVDPIVLDPATTWFDLYRDGGRVGVVFYLPDYEPELLDAYRVAAMRLMSQAVGEWAVGTEVGFVDFDAQGVRDTAFSRPFDEFASVFGKLRD